MHGRSFSGTRDLKSNRFRGHDANRVYGTWDWVPGTNASVIGWRYINLNPLARAFTTHHGMPGMAKNPINTLALKVVRAMCMGLDNKGTGNLAVAPHCLWTVLSMLASSLRNGTRAKDEMIKGLSYETQEGETGAIRWNEELLTTLRMDGVVHLDFSVWAAAASEEYENAMLCKYNALFCGKADMRTINEYVSGKTAGMISQILVEEPNQDPVFLGTTYMKPKWDKQFDPAKTCEDKFFDTDNSHIACMMMKAKMDVEVE